MALNVPGPWRRRSISGITLITSALLTPIIAPIASLIAFVRDRRSGTGRLRQTRIVALIASVVMVDLVGQIVVFGVWLQGPFGMNRTSPRIQDKYQKIMTWYTTKITEAIAKFAPLPVDGSELDESLLSGNAIVVARHRSIFDALIPAVLFGRRGLLTLYTLKDELQWGPNLDIVGHRMGHVFVNRSSKDLETELQPIRDLAARIDKDSVAVIFPEGTFFNQTRLKRAIKSLERRDPVRARMAAQFRHLLPPRPAGTLAMLEAAPDADVVLVGHVGFEPFGSVPEVFANIGDPRHRLRVKAWRFDRATIPTTRDEQIHWLFERWLQMDEWIDAYHPLASELPAPDQRSEEPARN